MLKYIENFALASWCKCSKWVYIYIYIYSIYMLNAFVFFTRTFKIINV